MARANWLGLIGAILSIVSVAMVWFWRMFDSMGYASGQTALTGTLNNYSSDVSLVFIVGAIVALLTPLGVMLQIPALVVFPFLIWYWDLSGYWVLGYIVALIGAAVSISSMFIQISFPGRRLLIPPETRIGVWSLRKEERQTRPLHWSAKITLLSLVIAAALVSTLIVTPAYARPMSKISVTVMIDGSGYEIDNVTVKVDNNVILHRQLANGSLNGIQVIVNATAGSHTLSVNLAGDNVPPDRWHSYQPWVIKVLPWTTEEVLLGYNVAFI